ncbi:YcaO-like family protein [Actinoplanes sp. HUAS TT8]|uniref:YcaO-like family protein n=1 Tax=Actinoplanes sp. HUAS TT8 TaxID=3447453 RepID=UPI003F5216AF
MRSDLLVDSRTGIVRRLDRRTVPAHFPTSYTIVDSYLADTTVFGPYPADSAGAGYAFSSSADGDRAVAAALGEAVERYCGNLVPPGLPVGPATAIPDAVDPATLALFSAEQYRQTGFPCVPLTADLAVPWARGVDVATGRSAAVPASLVWVNHPGGPRTNPIVQAGIATAATVDGATWSALCEVIERDAMTLAWTGRGHLTPLEAPAALRQLVRPPLHARWFAFPNDVGLPVIGALVRDDSRGYQALGMGAGADPGEAARKALGEALQLVLLLGDYDRPDSGFARAAAGPGSPLKPWRPNRDYAAAYRADRADVVDYGCHLQLHLDPAVQQRFETELSGTVRDGDPEWEPPTSLADLTDRLTGRGHRVLAVEVTTADVRAAGLHVVRVVVPGYYTNAAAGLPLLGGTRLPARLAGRAPRLLPLPH